MYKFTHAPETQIIHGLLKCSLCMHLLVLIDTYCTRCLRLCCACNKFPKKLALWVAQFNSKKTNCSIIPRNSTGMQFTDSYVPRWLFCTLSYIATKAPIIYNGMPNSNSKKKNCLLCHRQFRNIYTCSGKCFPIQVGNCKHTVTKYTVIVQPYSDLQNRSVSKCVYMSSI